MPATSTPSPAPATAWTCSCTGENWNLIDQDLLDDDVPVVEVSPSWTGVFHMKVIMASCYVSPCRYAVVA